MAYTTMNYQNPVLAAMAQGSDAMNRTASNAAAFGRSAYDAILRSGSLALKMDALLAEKEAQKQNQMLGYTKLLQSTISDIARQKMALASRARAVGRGRAGGGSAQGGGMNADALIGYITGAGNPQQRNQVPDTDQALSQIFANASANTGQPMVPQGVQQAAGLAAAEQYAAQKQQETETPTDRAGEMSVLADPQNQGDQAIAGINAIDAIVDNANDRVTQLRGLGIQTQQDALSQDMRAQNVLMRAAAAGPKQFRAVKNLTDSIRYFNQNKSKMSKLEFDKFANQTTGKLSSTYNSLMGGKPDMVLKQMGLSPEQIKSIPQNVKKSMVATQVLDSMQQLDPELAKRMKTTENRAKRIIKQNKPTPAQLSAFQQKIVDQFKSGKLDENQAYASYSQLLSRMGITGDEAGSSLNVLKSGIDKEKKKEQDRAKFLSDITGQMKDFKGEGLTQAQRIAQLAAVVPSLRGLAKELVTPEGADGLLMFSKAPLSNLGGIGDDETSAQLIFNTLKQKLGSAAINRIRSKAKSAGIDVEDTYDLTEWILEKMPSEEFGDLLGKMKK